MCHGRDAMGVTTYPDETQPQLREWLEQGWAWLGANPDHPDADAKLDEWLRVLRIYEERYGREDEDVDDRRDPAQVRVSG